MIYSVIVITFTLKIILNKFDSETIIPNIFSDFSKSMICKLILILIHVI